MSVTMTAPNKMFLPAEVHLRQGVSDHGAEHHVPEDGDHGDDHAVGEVGAEVQLPEPFREVCERGVLGQELRRFGEDLPLGLQRAQRHPQEREDPEDSDHREDAVGESTPLDESAPERLLVALRPRGRDCRGCHLNPP